MKSFKEFKGNISEAPENDPKEYDYEGEMAKNDMHIITMHAQHIADMLEDETNMPEWCQSKIAIAKDYLQTVCDYLHGEMNEEAEQIEEASYNYDKAMKSKNPRIQKKGIAGLIDSRINNIKKMKKDGSWYQNEETVDAASAKDVIADIQKNVNDPDFRKKYKGEPKKWIGPQKGDYGYPHSAGHGMDSVSGPRIRTAKKVSEESEQIDELSKDTLGSYVKKATDAKEKNWQYADAAAKRSKTPADTKQFLKHSEKFGKRTAGIKKAADKMGTEEE